MKSCDKYIQELAYSTTSYGGDNQSKDKTKKHNYYVCIKFDASNSVIVIIGI